VGKAANLRDRISSYFGAAVSPRVGQMLKEARRIRILPLRSEIEALVMEAKWIKSLKPKYNIVFRDDKNYFFVVITKPPDGGFPRIFITHQPKQIKNLNSKSKSYEVLGPYVSGRALRTTLRLLRRIFPYCTCQKPHERLCIQSQLGLCPGYCCQKNRTATPAERRVYHENISNIVKVLTGKGASLLKSLDKKIAGLVREKRFEEAALVRDEIRGLEKIFHHRGIIREVNMREVTSAAKTIAHLARILDLPRYPSRIECYDASVMSNTGPVGAMVVFENGAPQKAEWRLFRMRLPGSAGDPHFITEMILRRLKHKEWSLPQLIIVDGGIAQLNAIRDALKQSNLDIPSIAIAKGKTKNDRVIFGKPVKEIPVKTMPKDVSRLITYIRNETHRFAISFQRRTRKLSGR